MEATDTDDYDLWDDFWDCCAPFLRAAQQEGESPDSIRRKVLLLPPALSVFLFFLLFLLYELVNYQTSGPIRISLSVVALITLLVVVVAGFKTKGLSNKTTQGAVTVLLVCCLCSDLVNVGSSEQWTIAILLMDCLLVTEGRGKLSWCCFCFVTVWLVIRTVEDAFRFGMYDEIPQWDNTTAAKEEGVSWGCTALILRLGVFTLDYILTRRFALGLERQKERLRLSIFVAEEVAHALVRFDLEHAQRLVVMNESMALKVPFQRLLQNLRMYRPYLPASVFAKGDEADFDEDNNESFGQLDSLELSSILPGQVSETIHNSPKKDESQKIVELREIHLVADETRLKERLEVGVRMRKGSLLRSMFDVSFLGLQESFELAAPYAEIVLEEVRSSGGIALDLRGTILLASWNTHLPCPRHALSATMCALSITRAITSSMLQFPFFCCALASGKLAVGSTGLEWQRSPFVLGGPIHQVEALTALCRCIGARILMTEAVHEATSSRVVSRLVDVMEAIPTPFESDEQELVSVYEIIESTLNPSFDKYTNAFTNFRKNNNEAAISLLVDHLRSSPDDRQALRLLKLAAAEIQSPGLIHQPYYRRVIGWQQLELAAEDVDHKTTDENGVSEEAKKLITKYTHSFLERRTDSCGALPSIIESKQQLLSALSKLDNANADDMASVSTSAKRLDDGIQNNYKFKDLQGALWYMSDKCLGKGSYGEVWLGMGEDGGLVAMKKLRLANQRASTDIGTGPSTGVLDTMTSSGSSDSSEYGSPLHSIVDTERVSEVKKEVELLSALQHENIVCYFSVLVTRGGVIICMEYVPGGSLQNLLEQFGTIPGTSAKRYIKDCLRGLKYLHNKNVTHRDFKPGNVLVQIDGQCKLSDFGASAVMGDVVGEKVVGTLLYMSPEACKGQAITAADIWAVGITLAQMLTGKHAYSNLTFEPHAFLFAVANGKTKPEIPPLSDADAVSFIESCLQRDHLDRPTADELLLDNYLV